MITEFISGILISFVMIPESIAFAYLLDLPASVGIQSAMVMSFFTSLRIPYYQKWIWCLS